VRDLATLERIQLASQVLELAQGGTRRGGIRRLSRKKG
jgi:hypothetical protein